MMGSAKVAHQPVIQGVIRAQVGSGWQDTLDDDVFERWGLGHADRQSDGFAHTLAVKGIGVIDIVQKRLYVGIGGGQPQLTSTKSELETATDAEVVGVILDHHLNRPMFARS